MIYQVGDVAELSAQFLNLDGVPTDPSTVSLLVQAPDNTQTTYTYPTPGQIVRDGVGAYHYDLSIAQAGPNSTSPAYLYRWIGSGTLDSVQEGSIVVVPTTLVPQPPAAAPSFTLADLQALNAAIASGAMEVRYQDRTVRYRSMAEMLTARSMIYGMLNPSLVNRQVRLHTARGV